MARVIRLDTTFTDETLPFLRADPILTDGSLFLLDPMHPSDPWSAGIPSDTAFVPNVATREAREVLADDEAEVRGVVVNNATFIDPTHGRFERTTLGAVHGIVGNVTAVPTASGLAFLLPTALKTYLATNWDNSIYVSLWWKGTRVSPATDGSSLAAVPARFGIGYTTLPSASYKTYLKATARRPTSPDGVEPSANNEAALDVLGTQRFSIGVTGHNGTAPANGSEVYAAVGNWGKAGYNITGMTTGLWDSWVMYRFYVEDLTVSGRSYGEVDAIDDELYTRHISTSGGRYYGDTEPTDPATIP
jgi:hypothetical protein